MCHKTMDFKPKRHLKPVCLRKTVKPRIELKLLRVSVDHHTGFSHWRSHMVKSTIRKYIHKEKKRVQAAKTAKTTEKYDEIHFVCTETGAVPLLHQPRPAFGAMAPENTTQYLMDQVYEDLQLHERPVWSFAAVSPQNEALNADTTLENGYDAFLDFQQRDFEAQW
ncbi:hypothetical protein NQD34_009186 [Periophthalmus magnuspinnatus]|nr:hypothetical protein NQD34_009186 [Periophthalmus magnuspinnatus]